MVDSPQVDITGDHHIHTLYCNHAKGGMEDYVLAAIRKGLASMTFLEHLECNISYDHRTWLTPELFTQYFREGRRLQELYKEKIQIQIGVEVGYNPDALQEIQDLLSRFPFEHIGLSFHFLKIGRNHINIVSRRQKNILAIRQAGPEQILNHYFDGLINACSIISCDKICHLDAALRHLSDICLTSYHHLQINKLLHIMRQQKIALEINTSGFDIRSAPYPSSTIINNALSLGIPLIAGSDAHNPDQVARGFDLLANTLP